MPHSTYCCLEIVLSQVFPRAPLNRPSWTLLGQRHQVIFSRHGFTPFSVNATGSEGRPEADITLAGLVRAR